MIKLKPFQEVAKKQLIELLNKKNKEKIVMQAPTGSGKTIILSDTIKDCLTYTKGKLAFIWFTPGNGELEEQSKSKFLKFIPEYTAKNLDEAIKKGINDKEVIFINWEQVNKKDNKALREQERKNLLDRIQECKDGDISFIIIVDESHTNNTTKTREIVEIFGKCKKVFVSATIDKKKMPLIDIDIDEEDVIRSGLITKFININEGISKKTNIGSNEEETLIDLAIEKQKEIKKEYQKIGLNINPLIIIQYPNETKNKKEIQSSAALMQRVDSYLKNKGYCYNNSSVACWLDGDKKNIQDDNQPFDDVVFLHTKQALATGWDCPRAKILIKLRDNMNESFEIQVLGRIRRMPEQKHYDNPTLDNCYLYTLDNKYKEAAVRTFGGKETKILYIKEEYKSLDLGLKKELKSIVSDDKDDQSKAKVACDYIVKKYKLEEVLMSEKDKNGYTRNKSKLEKISEDKDGYDFNKKIKINVVEDKASSMSKMLEDGLRTTTIEQEASNEEIYNKYKNAIWIISSAVSLPDNIVRTILQKLFLIERTNKKRQRNSIGITLDLNKKDFRIFVTNNKEQIIKDIRESRYAISEQVKSTLTEIKQIPFSIPIKDIVYFDSSKKEYVLDSNVYDDYTSNINRSLPEQRFEKYCEDNDNVEWLYKNGDKGQNYLSIVYIDNYGKENLFYPDYILKVNGKLFIVETKGGLWKDGESKNIDKDKVIPKFNALKNYAEKHNKANPDNQINWCFVKDEDVDLGYGKVDYELFYSNTKWTEDLDKEHWKPLKGLF